MVKYFADCSQLSKFSFSTFLKTDFRLTFPIKHFDVGPLDVVEAVEVEVVAVDVDVDVDVVPHCGPFSISLLEEKLSRLR